MINLVLSLASAAAATGLLLAANTTAAAASSHAENTGTFLHMAMVEFPTGDGCGSQADNLVSHLTARGYHPTIRTVTNTDLFCGVSFSLANTRRNATNAVKDLGGTLRASHVQLRRQATVAGSSEPTSPPEAIHTLTGVDKARSELGLTGKGITVAVIDAGVYYLHPALGGCFGAGCKVVRGYDFVGNSYNGSSVPEPDSDPLDDCSDVSHGTHVSGIVAGDARNITQAGFVPLYPWTGVAPDAKIAAYRVFGCSGGGANDVITSAIYKAAEEGADIINMSLGVGPTLADDTDAVAINRVSQSGVLVFVSAGNSGDAGLLSVSTPSTALGAFSVAAVQNAETVQFQLKVGDSVFPWSPGSVNGSFASPQQLDIFVNNPNAVAQDVHDDGCTKVDPGAAGKAVLLRWGSGCGSGVRCTMAAQAGATACILYSDVDDVVSVAGDAIPTAMTSREAGAAILANPKAAVVITKNDKVFPYKVVGTVSSFSSGGVDAELHMKPDFGAIGGQVYSCLSPHAAQAQSLTRPYVSFDGTSMASPYAAGIGALLLQKRGKLSFDEMKAALLNNAVPMRQYQSKNIDTVALQGAGLLNIYNAATAKTVVTPSFLALNDSQYTRKDHYSVNIQNNYDKPVSYTVKHVGALTANPFDGVTDFVQPKAAFTTNFASLGFGNKQEAVFTTVVAANASYQVNVKVTPPASANPALFPLYSGYIAITNNVDASTVHVPYIGMVGTWMDAPIFAVRHPAAVDRAAGFYTSNGSAIAAGSTVNVTAGNVMLFSSYAGTTRNGIAEVVYTGSDAGVKEKLRKIGVAHGRNQGIPVIRVADNGPIAGAYFGPAPRNSPVAVQGVSTPVAYYWAGDVVATTEAEDSVLLPPGEYKLRLRGLKHFKPPGYQGDQHYHIIETPSFNIVY
ncbi:peptidase S8/S53 domain-containing protein [Zopfochytrium polystomum]|nr:peptidase S8/S53 domain-containing protein [Zopfochytrium polystomum]